MYYQYYKIELNGEEDELYANLKNALTFKSRTVSNIRIK